MSAQIARWLSVLLVSAAPIAGCSRGDRFRPVHLEAGESLIVVYRPRSLVSPGPVQVFVDQRSAGPLGRKEHVAVIVPPGEHLVRVERRASVARSIATGEGESGMLEAGAMVIGGTVSLSTPEEGVARDRLATTRAAAPVRRLSDLPENRED